MSDESVILINLLKAKAGKQDALLGLLKQNTDTVIRTLHGWKTTRLIAAKDGASVVIYSEWESAAAVEAMRSDPRMKAYFPKINDLASLDSILGSAVSSEAGKGECPSSPRRNAMARMVVVYRTPEHADAFDQHYFETHVPLAKKMPGLRKYEVSDGPIATPMGVPNVHRIGTLHFDDLAGIEKAFASAEGQAAGADRRHFAADDSGVEMFLFENREV